jgi:hypothetical protein
MQWNTSFVGSPESPAADQVEMLAFAGGVQWLGMPQDDPRWRAACAQVERPARPAIFGSAHGPRLLELVAAAG